MAAAGYRRRFPPRARARETLGYSREGILCPNCVHCSARFLAYPGSSPAELLSSVRTNFALLAGEADEILAERASEQLRYPQSVRRRYNLRAE